jgi:PAS domain-containing protein
MKSIENNKSLETARPAAAIVYGLLGGIFAFMVISIMLQPLRFDPVSVLGVALGGSVVTGFFLARERYLTSRIQALEDEGGRKASAAVGGRETFLRNAVAAFVRYDAVNFRILQASPGLLALTGRKGGEEVQERSMVDVLLTESSAFRKVSDAVRREGPEASFALECRRKDGQALPLVVSGFCPPGSSVVELALAQAGSGASNLLELEEKEGDLERFRRGMIRREFRILELKNEINTLCDELGKRRRYRIDSETRDALVEELMKEKQMAART